MLHQTICSIIFLMSCQKWFSSSELLSNPVYNYIWTETEWIRQICTLDQGGCMAKTGNSGTLPCSRLALNDVDVLLIKIVVVIRAVRMPEHLNKNWFFDIFFNKWAFILPVVHLVTNRKSAFLVGYLDLCTNSYLDCWITAWIEQKRNCISKHQRKETTITFSASTVQ